MPYFRKKPVVIEAVQFVGGKDSASEIQDWAKRNEIFFGWDINYDTLSIPTLEGDMSAKSGDWIIKGIAGEFYPCKNDIFVQTYEETETP